MDKSDINYQKIDKGIRDLVRTLNQIPCVTTQASCEGHLREDSGWTGFLPDQGHKFLYGGDMIFQVNRQHPDSTRFLDDVQQVERRYSFVGLHEHRCREEDCSIEGSRVLDLGYSDLTHPETIKERDSLEVMIKKRHQVETSIGMQRVRDYQKVWRDFLAVAERYV